MKNYSKPQVRVTEFQANETIASLSEWLSDNSLTDAGITTYVVNS